MIRAAATAALAAQLVSPTPAGAVARPSAVSTDAGTALCVSVSRQVVTWSRREGRGRDRPHVVAIRRQRVVTNRLRRSPTDGVLLSCAGQARLSNGLRAPVSFGMTAVNGTWYLFLHRVRQR